MSDEIKIPREALSKCESMDCDRYVPENGINATYCQHDIEAVARWMREECAKVAEGHGFHQGCHKCNVDISKAIRLIGTNLQ